MIGYLEEDIASLNNEFDLGDKTKFILGCSGDYDSDGNYNVKIASLLSDPVKRVIDPYINTENGFCIEKSQEFINRIPKEEISEDIANMYNYLVGENV
jgi:hypothetical protein